MAQRLNKHTGKLGQFHAWNKCLSHILALARAHIESVIYTHFIEGVNKCSDADCRKSLKVWLAHAFTDWINTLPHHYSRVSETWIFHPNVGLCNVFTKVKLCWLIRVCSG